MRKYNLYDNINMISNKFIIILLHLIFFIISLPILIIFPRLIWYDLKPDNKRDSELMAFSEKVEKFFYYWRLKKYYDSETKLNIEKIKGQWGN